jgi:hypothetical protein
MSFEEFENLARLYVVGALDEMEVPIFTKARQDFGDRGEEIIADCQKLNAAFALSLRPQPPKEDAKAKLMGLIQKSMGKGRNLSAR